MTKKAFDVHKAFAENLAYGDEVLWDAYAPNQLPVFEQKLKELYRDPEKGGSNKNKAMQKIRQTLYDQTISQTKYTNKNLLSTFILVTVSKGKTLQEAQNATNFSLHIIIRTRKCIKKDDSSSCCMIFIDEHGRVYQNWKHFIETNLLPEGLALAPFNGIYTYEKDQLRMVTSVTPASELGTKIVSTTDIAAGISGFAAAGVTLAAICTAPIAGPVLAGASIVCIGTGVYSAIRSGWQLWTRSDHEQSIAITDQTARGCWLGVASGAMVVGTSAVNKSLSKIAFAGKNVSMVRQTVVNGVNISSMFLSGTGVANGIVDIIVKYHDDEEVNALEFMQLAASLVIFTHSVYNFRLASKIVSQAQDSKLNSYRSELSRRQRKMFDKLTKETVRTKGASTGKRDVIRLVNEIPDKQYLNDLHKINKNLNKNDIRFSAGKDGNVVLNNEVAVKPSVLRSNIQHAEGENILGKVTKPIPTSHKTIPNDKTVNMLTTYAFSKDSSKLSTYCRTIFNIAENYISNMDRFQNCVQYLLNHLEEGTVVYLIKKAKDFIQKFSKQVEDIIKTRLDIETVLWDLYVQCKTIFIKQLEHIVEEKIKKYISKIFQSLLKYYEEMSSESPTATKVLCDVCHGFYSICSISS